MKSSVYILRRPSARPEHSVSGYDFYTIHDVENSPNPYGGAWYLDSPMVLTKEETEIVIAEFPNSGIEVVQIA